jgi:hypothetical protein
MSEYTFEQRLDDLLCFHTDHVHRDSLFKADRANIINYVTELEQENARLKVQFISVLSLRPQFSEDEIKSWYANDKKEVSVE